MSLHETGDRDAQAKATIRVEVAYATPQKQLLLKLEMDDSPTVEQAIIQSGILDQFPEIDLSSAAVGVFSRKATLNDRLRDGDRVEIYRPLLADPKEVRRQVAEERKAAAAALKRKKNPAPKT